MHPIVQVGKGGLDDGLIAAVDRALADHELVKVRVGPSSGDSADESKAEVAERLAQQTKSEVAQIIGNIVLLYRADPDEPVIALP